jgi:hypothetical protein
MKKANEVAKKKVARRPRPKLDVDRYFHPSFLLFKTPSFFSKYRLIGPKGLDELCNLFKDEKFQGKGYEVSFNLFFFILINSK